MYYYIVYLALDLHSTYVDTKEDLQHESELNSRRRKFHKEARISTDFAVCQSSSVKGFAEIYVAKYDNTYDSTAVVSPTKHICIMYVYYVCILYIKTLCILVSEFTARHPPLLCQIPTKVSVTTNLTISYQ